jgi:transcriptional regulator with XRE-family HTH domain
MKKKKDLQRLALDAPRLSLDDLAEAAGVSRGSIARYRLQGKNRVRMPEYVAKRLATFLRQHASQLEEIADELDQVEDD